jgi:hypothetical protein
MTSNTPLDPTNLDATLRHQYDLQVRLLSSLNLLEGEPEEQYITAIDGKRYPLPAFDVILAELQTPDLQRKLTQGLDTLLLVPFGLPLARLLDAWRDGLRRNEAILQSVGAFNQQEPLYVWDGYRTEPLVYNPHAFRAQHRGYTKEQLLASDGRGFDVLLVEGTILNIPRADQGYVIGDRRQTECSRSPDEYLRDLPEGEVGLTPEAYAIHFLYALEHCGQVLDHQTATYLIGAYTPRLGTCRTRTGPRVRSGALDRDRSGQQRLERRGAARGGGRLILDPSASPSSFPLGLGHFFIVSRRVSRRA